MTEDKDRVEIIVNGRKKVATPSELSYHEVVMFDFDSLPEGRDTLITATYRKGACTVRAKSTHTQGVSARMPRQKKALGRSTIYPMSYPTSERVGASQEEIAEVVLRAKPKEVWRQNQESGRKWRRVHARLGAGGEQDTEGGSHV